MKSGDRVTVTVLGARVPATVVVPVTALGNVEVALDTPAEFGARVPVRHVVRAPDDVEVLRPDPSRPYEATSSRLPVAVYVVLCVVLVLAVGLAIAAVLP